MIWNVVRVYSDKWSQRKVKLRLFIFSDLFVAVDCGVPQIPMNGSVKGSKTDFPNVVQFACDEGFIRQGSQERQCLSNGSWSGNQTLCKGY